jgi:hypothetical protein
MGELAIFSSILTVLTTPFAFAEFAVPDQIVVASLSTTFIAVAPLWKTNYCLRVKPVKDQLSIATTFCLQPILPFSLPA